MRWVSAIFLCLAGLAGLGLTEPARAGEAASGRSCLPIAEAQEAVTSRRVIAPSAAIVAAKTSVPESDILRASLCREEDALVYRIVALRHDGRVVWVTVDAPSGKLRAIH